MAQEIPTRLNNFSHAITLLVAGALGMIATLLPWIDVGLASRSLVAWSTDGVLVLACFGGVFVLAIVGTSQRAISASSALTCLVCIVGAALLSGFAVHQIVERADTMALDAMPSQIMGAGVYVVGASSLTGLIAAIAALLASPIPQLDRAPWIPVEARLKRLADLRELRKISQGEYLYQVERIKREAPQTGTARTIRQRLEEIDELRRDGLITDEEHAKKRATIIEDG